MQPLHEGGAACGILHLMALHYRAHKWPGQDYNLGALIRGIFGDLHLPLSC